MTLCMKSITIGSNCRTSYVSNYFYCRIRSAELLRDAECDLLAIAKLLVGIHVGVQCSCLFAGFLLGFFFCKSSRVLVHLVVL